jgi:ABC-type uncharacterized transport system substrate-binding protein
MAAVGSLGCRVGLATRRILYVNSYHTGYGSSDDVMAGLRSVLEPQHVEMETFFLDAKRAPEQAAVEARAADALAAIREAHFPRALVVSDDAAVQYLVVPHFREGPLPVVFCGVNWSCEQYGLPTDYVTGMLEVLPIEETIASIRPAFPNIKRLAHLSENSLSERSNRRLMDGIYSRLGLEPAYSLVDDFESWKDAFLTANTDADLIFMPTNGAIRNWDNDAARAWIDAHIGKPIITCDDFMMPFAVFGLTKVAREQGEWAAAATLEILGGKRPADIPVTRNSKTQAWLNPALAEKVGFNPGADILNRCKMAG